MRRAVCPALICALLLLGAGCGDQAGGADHDAASSGDDATLADAAADDQKKGTVRTFQLFKLAV